MVNYSCCPYCKSKDIELFLTSKDYFFTGEEFSIFKCSACGLLMTQDVPSAEDIGAYYKSDNYLSHDAKNNSFFAKLYRAARRYMISRKRNLIEKNNVSDGNRILDIGCGTGFFLEGMKNGGWKTKGYEQDKDMVAYAYSKLGLRVVVGQEFMNETESYDVITMWHVLEHVYDFPEYLKKIYSLLEDKGLLVLALPNPESYDAKLYGKYWAGYDMPRHLWHFTPDFVKKMTSDAGFTVEKIKPMPLDAFYCSILSERYKGRSLAMVRGALAGCAAFCSAAFKGKRKSSSLIYLIRKK